MKLFGATFFALTIASLTPAAQDLVSAIHGTIDKLDLATKTIVVKTRDGAQHSLRFVDKTAVHGARASADVGKDSWRGLKEGTEVVAHYTRRGSEDTAIEVDRVDEDGLKKVGGTIKDFDRGSKKLIVAGADGVESAFRLTDHAAQDAGRDIATGSEKGTKVTVYYSEDAGNKVAHFFEKG